MKKIILLGVLSTMMFTSCKKDEVQTVKPTGSYTHNGGLSRPAKVTINSGDAAQTDPNANVHK
jgi:hypothetical protein